MKIILISFLMIMLVPVRTFAEEADPLSVYDFSDINSVLKEDNSFNFEDCVREIIKGDFDSLYRIVRENIGDGLLHNLSGTYCMYVVRIYHCCGNC